MCNAGRCSACPARLKPGKATPMTPSVSRGRPDEILQGFRARFLFKKALRAVRAASAAAPPAGPARAGPPLSEPAGHRAPGLQRHLLDRPRTRRDRADRGQERHRDLRLFGHLGPGRMPPERSAPRARLAGDQPLRHRGAPQRARHRPRAARARRGRGRVPTGAPPRRPTGPHGPPAGHWHGG